MKNWNWETFWFIMAITALGLVANENVHSVTQWFILTLGFGIPFVLMAAWMSEKL